MRFSEMHWGRPSLEAALAGARALAEKAAGKTQIVVTQRVTSAMSSDQIFVMDGGRLVDSGTHQELLERCKVYREIYLSQTGGERR